MFNRFKKETVFPIPDVRRADERAPLPASIKRHYLKISKAMEMNDKPAVHNRQLRLLRGGFEVPVTHSQCKEMLEKFNAA